jgi:hypothetical protein
VVRASEWDDAAFEEILNAPGGLVANFIWELSVEAAAVATAVVHVLPGTPRSGFWGPRSTAVRPPGYTRARIRPHLAWGARTGHVYGGVNAPADPSIFLEFPAEQMYDVYPFLTTGLWSLEGTF